MKSSEIEILIEAHREEEREERNRLLRLRLVRPRSREELLSSLGDQAPSRTEESAILLTKSSAPFIMEVAR